MVLRSILARNLKRLRAQRGLSQEALADLVGIDRTYVGSLERERYAASLDVLERLALSLDTPAWQLLRDEGEPPSNRRG